MLRQRSPVGIASLDLSLFCCMTAKIMLNQDAVIRYEKIALSFDVEISHVT